MERLTEKNWRNLDPWECCGQDYYCRRGCHEDGGCAKGCIVPRIYARLAVYEDTGLEPEEVAELCALDDDALSAIKLAATHPFIHLRELVQAEQDGRLLMIPASDFGVTTFPVSEEAKAALEAREGGGKE